MTLLQRNNIGHVVAAMACMVCLALVWIPAIFVTGDGACHVYNAQLLNDVWQGKYTEFYNAYYTPNLEPNPNWTSHLLLAGLMCFFNGITSEKILLSVYDEFSICAYAISMSERLPSTFNLNVDFLSDCICNINLDLEYS